MTMDQSLNDVEMRANNAGGWYMRSKGEEYVPVTAHNDCLESKQMICGALKQFNRACDESHFDRTAQPQSGRTAMDSADAQQAITNLKMVAAHVLRDDLGRAFHEVCETGKTSDELSAQCLTTLGLIGRKGHLTPAGEKIADTLKAAPG
jgi:hypothetical protein